LNQQ